MAAMKVKDPFLPVAVIVVLAAIAAGYYYWIQGQREAAPPPAPPAAEIQPAPQAQAEPVIRHPIESVKTQAPVPQAKPLPPLRESDETVQTAAAELIGRNALERLFHLKEIVRRFVVTVEELPRKKIGQRYNLMKPVSGHFLVTRKDDDIFLSPANYRRYTPYVMLAQAIDTKKLVAMYVHFYPLFQEEYKTLGYPKRYFNDRLIDTIDDLLAAPDVRGPVKLSQPKVVYEFADPALESLSVGQKIMIRMGSDNAAKIKAKLREIRSEIATVQ